MASTSVGSIQIDFTANIKKLLTATERVDKRLQRLQKSANKAKKNLANFAKAAVGVYALGKAFEFAVGGSLKFNQQMEDAEVKLRAMIESASSFETISGRIVSAQERQNIVMQQTTYTMGLLKKINAETAFGMQDLITSYALMKPAMDRRNVSIDEQIKLLKLISNTSTTFGLSNQELSTGIDDLATGTYRTTQSFGKMMKALGISREEIKNTTDLYGYLSKKLEATGKAQDTMTVAVSNFGVSFDTLRGKLTEGIFDQLKTDLKILTKQMDTTSPQAMQVFADAITDMANIGINAIAALTLSITGLISLMQTVYGGYQKLAGLVGGGVSSSALEQHKKDLKELQRIQKEGDYGWFSNQNAHIVDLNIKKQKKAIAEITADQKYFNELRTAGDKQVEETAKKQAAITDATLTTASTLHLEHKKITKELKKQTKAAEKLKKIQSNSNAPTSKGSAKKLKKDWEDALKAANKQAKELDRTLQDAASSFADTLQRGFESILRGDFAGGLADLLGDALGKATSNLSNAFSTGLGNLATGAGSFASAFSSINPMDWIGSAASLLGGLMSNTLSQEEIDRAAGVSSFDTKSLTDIKSILEDNQAPQLTATRSMLHHLESMDGNFAGIANALSSSTGFDFGGDNYQASSSSNWWGGSSRELIGSGLNFGQQTVNAFLEGVDVAGYQAEKVVESSFFGLVSSESIKETAIDVPQSVKDDFSKALNNSLESIYEAADILGFDTEAIKKKIDTFVLDLGKINFKDLNAEEKKQALEDAFSGQLNEATEAAISSIASPENIAALENMALAGEDYTTTLVRAAVQQEYVSKQLALFGQTVDDFATSDSLVQAAGGLEKFKDAMDTFVSRFYSDEEQLDFLKQQLTTALAVYDTALPASKAQFKALVLETQQKIINVKATIASLKAEVAAKVASGEISIKAAYGELAIKGQIADSLQQVTNGQIQANNGLIASSHEAGKAAVSFGNSMHAVIEGIATGTAQAAVDGAQVAVDSAGNIDYDKITSPAIAAAEAELANLEGLYGTLMDNMNSFADYYDGVEQAASDAADKLDALTKSLIDIANLKATWGGDSVEGSRLVLEATQKYTGLGDVTYENFLQKFTDLTKDGKGLDDKTLQNWQDISSALRDLHNAQEQTIKDTENFKDSITSAWTGSLSYLNSYEKIKYLDNIPQDDKSYLDKLKEKLALEKKTSVTKEEYSKTFDRYISDLEKAKPEATTDDVVQELRDIRAALEDLQDVTEQASYQGQTA